MRVYVCPECGLKDSSLFFIRTHREISHNDQRQAFDRPLHRIRYVDIPAWGMVEYIKSHL